MVRKWLVLLSRSGCETLAQVLYAHVTVFFLFSDWTRATSVSWGEVEPQFLGYSTLVYVWGSSLLSYHPLYTCSYLSLTSLFPTPSGLLFSLFFPPSPPLPFPHHLSLFYMYPSWSHYPLSLTPNFPHIPLLLSPSPLTSLPIPLLLSPSPLDSNCRGSLDYRAHSAGGVQGVQLHSFSSSWGQTM